jgi:hypothetical protein
MEDRTGFDAFQAQRFEEKNSAPRNFLVMVREKF